MAALNCPHCNEPAPCACNCAACALGRRDARPSDGPHGIDSMRAYAAEIPTKALVDIGRVAERIVQLSRCVL